MTDTLIEQPALVDEDGNIRVNGREGLWLELDFKDVNDDYINVAASTMYFEVRGKIRKALINGTENYTKIIVLTRSEVAAMGTATLPFAMIDETPVVPDVLWEGKLRVKGFLTQPA